MYSTTGNGWKLKVVAKARYALAKPVYILNQTDENRLRYVNTQVMAKTSVQFTEHLIVESSPSVPSFSKCPFAMKSESNWSLSWKAFISQLSHSFSVDGISSRRMRRT